jgi:hypothetical protein
MLSRGEFDAETSRRRRGGTKARPDSIARLSHADPAKRLLMKHISQLVAGGYAEWKMLDSGDIQFRFGTGEMFLLTEITIIRLA